MLGKLARSATLAFVIALALLPGVPAGGAAGQPKKHKISANFIFVRNNVDGCGWGIGIAFPKVAKATAYLVRYFDRQYGQVVETTKAAEEFKDPSAGKGSLYLGVTGGTYSGPCEEGGGDATAGGRFSKGATAFAILPPELVTIAGRITQMCPGRCSAADRIAGVTVTAKGAGKTYRATTRADGGYTLTTKKGSFRLRPKLSGFTFDPRARRVSARHDVKGVNFTACGGRGARNAPFAFAAQSGQTYTGERIANEVCGLDTFTATLSGVTASKATIVVKWDASTLCSPGDTNRKFTWETKPQSITKGVDVQVGFDKGDDFGSVTVNIPTDAPDRVLIKSAGGVHRGRGLTCNGKAKPTGGLPLYPGGSPPAPSPTPPG